MKTIKFVIITVYAVCIRATLACTARQIMWISFKLINLSLSCQNVKHDWQWLVSVEHEFHKRSIKPEQTLVFGSTPTPDHRHQPPCHVPPAVSQPGLPTPNITLFFYSYDRGKRHTNQISSKFIKSCDFVSVQF